MKGRFLGPGNSQEHIEAVLFLLDESPPPRRMGTDTDRRDYLQRLVEAFLAANERLARVSQGIRHTPDGFFLVPLPTRHLTPPSNPDDDKTTTKERLARQIADFLAQDLEGITAFPSPRPVFVAESTRGREAIWQRLLEAIHHRPPLVVR